MAPFSQQEYVNFFFFWYVYKWLKTLKSENIMLLELYVIHDTY